MATTPKNVKSVLTSPAHPPMRIVSPLLEGLDATDVPSSTAEFSGYLMSILTEARVLVANSREWPVIKNSGIVALRKKPIEKIYDHGKNIMLQRHYKFANSTGVTYDELKSLLWDFAENLPKWYKSVQKVEMLQEWHESVRCSWLGCKSDSLFVSKRCFCGLTIREEAHRKTGGREFAIVTVDMQHPDEEKKSGGFVRGKMMWIEYVSELADGSIEHVGVARADVGGHLPRFLVDYFFKKDYIEDVRAILKYYKKDALFDLPIVAAKKDSSTEGPGPAPPPEIPS